jgi:hypothetical protein
MPRVVDIAEVHTPPAVPDRAASEPQYHRRIGDTGIGLCRACRAASALLDAGNSASLAVRAAVWRDAAWDSWHNRAVPSAGQCQKGGAHELFWNISR